MIFEPLAIDGAFRVSPERREDARGFFARMWCAEEFAEVGIVAMWSQVNVACNRVRGTLRGLHFQRPPMADAKLVCCLRGSLLDVIVDLRAGSATYGRAECVPLDDELRGMVFVPAGCAHGYQTLAADVELLYFHSAAYAPAHEGGLHFDDPALAIPWPLPPAEISARDRTHPTLADLEPIRA